MRELLGVARDFLDLSVAWLGRVDGSRYEVVAVDGDAGIIDAHPGDVLDLEQTTCRHALRDGGPLVLPDLAAWRARERQPARDALRSYVGVPVLRADGSVYGAFCVGGARPALQLDDRHRRLVMFLARMAGVIIDRVRGAL